MKKENGWHYKRISKSDLDSVLTFLNEMTPPFQNFRYATNTDFSYTPNAYSLVVDDQTEHDDHTWRVSNSWRVSHDIPTKRAMNDWMWAYIAGIEDGQKILTSVLNKKKD